MRKTPSLDPEDWPAFRALARRMLEAALDHMEGAADRPVWRETPPEARAALRAPVPWEGAGAEAAAEAALEHILPFATGNTHPRFFGWVHGAGTPGGLIAEILAAAMNANCGGRDHAAILVERQVIEWCREAFGFPEGAGGLVLSGTSMGTVLALLAARERAAPGARKRGVGAARLVGYASAESHSCIARAFDQIGLGAEALRLIPVDEDFRMRIDLLRETIRADREAGALPFILVGAAATVNTGATDDLSALADIAAAEGLWLHVDGAFGALAALSPALAPRLKGMERAESLAFDFHKWAHVNYDAGAVLVRERSVLLEAFGQGADYLAGMPRGLGGGKPWPSDMGIELSRGFRALKVWFALKEHGLNRIGEKIAENVACAARLARLVEAAEDFELLAPTPLNIACLRWAPPGFGGDLDALNREIVMRLQESGVAAPSTTMIRGRLAIRVNVTNHRTRAEDMDILFEAIRGHGKAALPPLATRARPG